MVLRSGGVRVRVDKGEESLLLIIRRHQDPRQCAASGNQAGQGGDPARRNACQIEGAKERGDKDQRGAEVGLRHHEKEWWRNDRARQYQIL